MEEGEQAWDWGAEIYTEVCHIAIMPCADCRRTKRLELDTLNLTLYSEELSWTTL